MIGNPLLLPTEGYEISRSVRTRGAYPASPSYFSRTAGTPTNNLKWTFSGWLKRGVLSVGQHLLNAGTGTSASEDYLTFLGSNKLAFYQGNGTTTVIATNAVYRDSAAWMHIVLVYDSAQATAANRLFIYVNGVSQSFSSATYPTLNQATNINASGVLQRISSRTYLADEGFDGYLTDINFIDGQALTPSSFGETDAITGVWKPKKYGGTYGTNGFYLNFSDNSAASAAAIGKDYSGNGNNWTPNNISVTAGVTYDSMIDVPTLYADGGNGRGNYAVLNPLGVDTPSSTTANGNLTLSNSASNQKRATIPVVGSDPNKYYWEVTINGTATGNFPNLGMYMVGAGTNWVGYDGNSIGLYQGGALYYNGSQVATLTSFADGDVISIAYDASSGKIWFAKNNTWMASGVPSTGTSPNYTLPTGVDRVAGGYTGSGYGTLEFNFGQRPFAYTPPTGFKALNTQNLPEPTIKKGNAYFDVSLYTGTGSAQSIVNSGAMQPDLVWLKIRGAAGNHVLFDSIRGADKKLSSSMTAAEETPTAGTGLLSFNGNGFSLGTDIAGVTGGASNTSPYAFVGWQWNAGGSTVTNTSGSISAQVRANATAGFSVVTYTGTQTASTVGHGLGVAPKMIIVKARSNGTYNWTTWHGTFTGNGYIYIDSNTTVGSSSGPWNGTLPTSSVFSLGADLGTNKSGDTYVAYVFTAVAGYSAFGSYTGNGSTDGPFVFTGFRPRYFLIKRTDASYDWYIHDTARDTYNTMNKELYPNTADAEVASSRVFDALSNGFKVRDSNAGINASGGTYIYAAFAENPFKYSLAR